LPGLKDIPDGEHHPSAKAIICIPDFYLAEVTDGGENACGDHRSTPDPQRATFPTRPDKPYDLFSFPNVRWFFLKTGRVLWNLETCTPEVAGIARNAMYLQDRYRPAIGYTNYPHLVDKDRIRDIAL
jgi:hypothetical protein